MSVEPSVPLLGVGVGSLLVTVGETVLVSLCVGVAVDDVVGVVVHSKWSCVTFPLIRAICSRSGVVPFSKQISVLSSWYSLVSEHGCKELPQRPMALAVSSAFGCATKFSHEFIATFNTQHV